jgi:hypothetical protein
MHALRERLRLAARIVRRVLPTPPRPDEADQAVPGELHPHFGKPAAAAASAGRLPGWHVGLAMADRTLLPAASTRR